LSRRVSVLRMYQRLSGPVPLLRRNQALPVIQPGSLSVPKYGMVL